ncbi:MAG: hypothetical protein OXI90_03340 [Gammaproteobacteria bacterium]|nr:hypothetical protein [Gammaproteobacteria bacterium]
MQLLATHFPYEMSVGSDGLWSFWNRYGRPVGVCLAEEDERWDAQWESYPPCRIKLHGLDDAKVRRLCCAEWLAEDGGPVEEESIRLYGKDSTPGASADDMAAYMDKLRVLIETGALPMLFPYGMALRDVDTWVFFNRGTGPVGVSPAVAVGWGHPEAEWPVRVRLAGLDGGTLESLGHARPYGGIWKAIPGQAVHFYDGGSVPTKSARHMDAYLGKLCALMVLDGAPDAG